MFYDNLLILCVERGETPSGVAKKVGLSNATATGWKNGKKPSQTTLKKLAQYLGVSTSELLGESPATANAYPQLSAEEERLLAVFRALDQTGRIKVQSFAEGLAAGSAKTSASEGGEQRLA